MSTATTKKATVQKSATKAKSEAKPKAKVAPKSEVDTRWDELVKACEDAQTAINDGQSEVIVKAKKDAVKKAEGLYNGAVAVAQYLLWNGEEDPVRTLIEARFIPGCVHVKYTVDKTFGTTTVDPQSAVIKASLKDFAKVCGFGKFAKGDTWWNANQKLAFVMALALNRELGGNRDFQYQIEGAAQTFNFPKDADPASKTSRVKALQYVVDAVLGENVVRVNTHDLVYIETSITRNGGVGKVNYGGTASMSDYITDVMYMRLTKQSYEVSDGNSKKK